jgi:hypothetical protein
MFCEDREIEATKTVSKAIREREQSCQTFLLIKGKHNQMRFVEYGNPKVLSRCCIGIWACFRLLTRHQHSAAVFGVYRRPFWRDIFDGKSKRSWSGGFESEFS